MYTINKYKLVLRIVITHLMGLGNSSSIQASSAGIAIPLDKFIVFFPELGLSIAYALRL